MSLEGKGSELEECTHQERQEIQIVHLPKDRYFEHMVMQHFVFELRKMAL